jgi:hypothetical protein
MTVRDFDLNVSTTAIGCLEMEIVVFCNTLGHSHVQHCMAGGRAMMLPTFLSSPQKGSNQHLLYQVMSTRSGSTLVVRVPINFYKYICKSHTPVNCI